MTVYFIALILSLVGAFLLYQKTKPVLTHKQKIGLLSLRFVMLYLLLLFLLSPILYFIRRYTERPTVLMLTDNSASMDIVHQGKSKTDALAAARNKLSAAYKSAGYGIRGLTFADGLKGKKNITLITPALEQIRETADENNLSQLILFSDGWYRDKDLSMLKNFDIPVSVVSDTAQSQLSDVQVTDFRHNKQGFRNELTSFETRLKADNYKGSATCAFYVGSQKIAERKISFQTDPVQTISFNYRFPKLGLQKVELRVMVPDIRETSLSNNSAVSAIDILTEKESILLLTDVPNWDTKFYLDTIRDNNRLEPISFTVKGGELYNGDARTILKSWDNIAAILIVNQGALQLSPGLASGIVNKARQGAGVLFMGLPVPQLAEILPLRLSNIRSSYTGLFRMLPAAAGYSAFNIPEAEINQIPPVNYYYLTSAAGSEVLATFDNASKSPAMAISQNNAGKVASFAFLNLWHWQMQGKNQTYRTFVSDLITWLGNKSTGSLTALYSPSYYQDEPVEIKLTALDEIRKSRQNLAPFITVYNSKQDSVLSDFMVSDKDYYSVSFRSGTPGEYSFVINDKASKQSVRGRFVIQSQNLETRDLGYNNSLLSWIAVQTGGKFITPDKASAYKPVKASSTTRINRNEYPLYKKWYVLIAFVLVFCLELFYRRRWGLL